MHFIFHTHSLTLFAVNFPLYNTRWVLTMIKKKKKSFITYRIHKCLDLKN